MTPMSDRLRLHLSRWSGAGNFLAWWGRSLAALLPRSLRLALGMDRGRLLLQSDADAVQLRLQDSQGVRDIARVPALIAIDDNDDPGIGNTRRDGMAKGDLAKSGANADGDALSALLPPALAELPRWLLLPAAAGLRRRMLLPSAAAERLRDVVGFEIDRQTPFAAADVAFDARILDRRDSDGQLIAELVVVPRQVLAVQQEALGSLAGNLAGIDVAGSDGLPLGVNLLAPPQRRQQLDPWRTWNWALAAVALVAFVAMLWQVLDNRGRAAEALQAQTDLEAASARRVSLQRQQLVDLVEGRAFLDQRRQSRPTAIEVLDALARRLPDNTYLEKLTLEDDHMLLIGLSGEASALVGRLEGAKPWRSPALTGALQPDSRSGRDRFTLTADLAVAPTASAAPNSNAQQEASDADAGAL